MADLTSTIRTFARATWDWPFAILDNNGWAWDEYDGVRYAHLHAAMALRALAGRLQAERWAAARPLSLAQHALADHQAAFRDFEALLVGLPDNLLATIPAPEEWPIETIVRHVYDVEHYFFSTILSALAGGSEEVTPASANELTGVPLAPSPGRPLAELWVSFETLHQCVQERLACLSDEQVQIPSTMWESTPYPILFRMQRFAAHLREHTNQLEKTLAWLGRTPGEAQMLVRQVYAALAEVEGLRIGQGEMGVAACAALAEEWEARFATVYAARTRIDTFFAAVQEGNADTVAALLAANPGLGYAQMDDGTTALLFSHYRGRGDLVRTFLDSGLRLSIFEAAALGDSARIERLLGWEPALIDAWSRDGYTPLQLACFFAHAEAVRLLLARGADVHAVARNAMQIQPLHAAVAGRNLEIVKMLLAAGADAGATQAGGITPIMAAEQHGDAEIAAALRSA